MVQRAMRARSLRSMLPSPFRSYVITVKLKLDWAVPPGAVTTMGPVVAPAGTVTEICEAPSTWKVVAAVPLKVHGVGAREVRP